MLSVVIHIALGAGAGLLIYEPLGSGQTLIGWVLVGIAILGHIRLWKQGRL